jgi:hypothetical protein
MLVNLTPHPVAVYGNRTIEDGPAEVIPPSGTIARVAINDLGMSTSRHSGTEFREVEYGDLNGLPAPQEGTDYIVSLVCALAAVRQGRDDLLAPFAEVRNESGTMIGCRYLQRVC